MIVSGAGWRRRLRRFDHVSKIFRRTNQFPVSESNCWFKSRHKKGQSPFLQKIETIVISQKILFTFFSVDPTCCPLCWGLYGCVSCLVFKILVTFFVLCKRSSFFKCNNGFAHPNWQMQEIDRKRAIHYVTTNRLAHYQLIFLLSYQRRLATNENSPS